MLGTPATKWPISPADAVAAVIAAIRIIDPSASVFRLIEILSVLSDLVN
jgi:hypothetical protein